MGSRAAGRGARRQAAALQGAPCPHGRLEAGVPKEDFAPAKSGRPRPVTHGGAAPPQAAESGRAPCVGTGVQHEPMERPQGNSVGVPLAGCPTVGLADRQSQRAGARCSGGCGRPARKAACRPSDLEPPCRPFRRWKVSPSTVSCFATGCKPVAGVGAYVGAIRRLATNKDDREARRPLEKQLELLGLKPICQADADAWKLAVAASEHNQGLCRMFQETPWAAGGWAEVLGRQPGAVRTNQRLAGDSIKVAVVPLLESVVQPVFDEEADSLVDPAPATSECQTVRAEWVD